MPTVLVDGGIVMRISSASVSEQIPGTVFTAPVAMLGVGSEKGPISKERARTVLELLPLFVIILGRGGEQYHLLEVLSVVA